MTGIPKLKDWKRDNYNSILVIINKLIKKINYNLIKIIIDKTKLVKVII